MSIIIDFFTRIYEFVVSLFSACLEWICNFFSTWIESLLATLDSITPNLSSYWSQISVIQPYFTFVNKWVAIDVGAALLSSYLVFIVSMIIVKLIIKLFIPTVG